MILYTPLPLELVTEGLHEMKVPVLREIEINGVRMIVQDEGEGKARVVRLLSTRPKDYLQLEFSPGSIINYNKP